MKKDQAQQIILEKIPATGEVEFEALAIPLRASKEGNAALEHFHTLRRAGVISARVDASTGELFLSRPAGKVG